MSTDLGHPIRGNDERLSKLVREIRKATRKAVDKIFMEHAMKKENTK